MLAAVYSLRAIRQTLSRAPSTLSRKLHSSPGFARHLSSGDRAPTDPALGTPVPQASEARGSAPLLRTAVFSLLAQRWSPKQIARGLPQRYPHEPTSGSRLRLSTRISMCCPVARSSGSWPCICAEAPVRRPRKVRLSSRPIQDPISIDERPKEVTDRTVPGHWEGDSLVGHANASALGTLWSAHHAIHAADAAEGQDAATVRHAFARELRTLPARPRH